MKITLWNLPTKRPRRLLKWIKKRLSLAKTMKNSSQNIGIYGRLRQGAKEQKQSSSKIRTMVSGNRSRAYPGKSESLRNKQTNSKKKKKKQNICKTNKSTEQ